MKACPDCGYGLIYVCPSCGAQTKAKAKSQWVSEAERRETRERYHKRYGKLSSFNDWERWINNR